MQQEVPKFQLPEVLAELENVSKEQIPLIVELYNVIGGNIAKRLGISFDEYKKSFKVVRHDDLTERNLLNIFRDNYPYAIANFGESDEVKILYQPNNEYQTLIQKNPKIKALKGIDENNINHVWAAKWLASTEGGKELLGKVSSIEEVENYLRERVDLYLDEAKNTDRFYIQDISDKYIDQQIERGNNSGNSPLVYEYTEAKKDKQRYIENKRELQRSGLVDTIAYLKSEQNYPSAMKVLLIASILKNSYFTDANGKVSVKRKIS